MISVTLQSSAGAPFTRLDSAAASSGTADAAGDVYQAWKTVFEHAKATDPVHDESRHSDLARDVPNDAIRSPAAAADSRGREVGEPRIAETLPRQQVVAAARAIGHADSQLQSRASARGSSTESLLNVVVAAQTVFAQVPASGEYSPRAPANPVLPYREARENREASTASNERGVTPDSINVTVHEDAVTIVVRDAAMSDHEALQCAFETARELTGRRMSLANLTLNGRTLYTNSAPARDSELQPTTVAFSC